jgi:hypothetical protein
MIEIFALPAGLIIALVSFGIGVGKFKENSATKQTVYNSLRESQAILEHKIIECRREQIEKINDLCSERKEIWEIVRQVEKRTAIIEEGMAWIKHALNEIKDSVNKMDA